MAGPAGELIDPEASAEAAGLRYVGDESPGIRRRRAGKSFAYYDARGQKVTDEKTLARIRSLAIPPAWTDVWICPSPHGHLQATGRDARGRKQYRYHPRWREVRDAVKYDRMVALAEALPAIRRRVDEDLSRPGLPREKVLAAVVRLLEETHIRVGSDEYRRANNSFGLTTLLNRHVQVEGTHLRFRFRGKGGKLHDVELADRRLARIVRRCRDIPGQELFQYVDDEGERRDVTSGDVNEYIRTISGGDFTAKDFRTWAGTVLAARHLSDSEPGETDAENRSAVVRCIEVVSQELGNTVAVCRKCYVHPAVIDAFMRGRIAPLPDSAASAAKSNGSAHVLTAEERALVELLRAAGAAASEKDGSKARDTAPRAA